MKMLGVLVVIGLCPLALYAGDMLIDERLAIDVPDNYLVIVNGKSLNELVVTYDRASSVLYINDMVLYPPMESKVEMTDDRIQNAFGNIPFVRNAYDKTRDWGLALQLYKETCLRLDKEIRQLFVQCINNGGGKALCGEEVNNLLNQSPYCDIADVSKSVHVVDTSIRYHLHSGVVSVVGVDLSQDDNNDRMYGDNDASVKSDEFVNGLVEIMLGFLNTSPDLPHVLVLDRGGYRGTFAGHQITEEVLSQINESIMMRDYVSGSIPKGVVMSIIENHSDVFMLQEEDQCPNTFKVNSRDSKSSSDPKTYGSVNIMQWLSGPEWGAMYDEIHAALDNRYCTDIADISQMFRASSVDAAITYNLWYESFETSGIDCFLYITHGYTDVAWVECYNDLTIAQERANDLVSNSGMSGIAYSTTGEDDDYYVGFIGDAIGYISDNMNYGDAPIVIGASCYSTTTADYWKGNYTDTDYSFLGYDDEEYASIVVGDVGKAFYYLGCGRNIQSGGTYMETIQQCRGIFGYTGFADVIGWEGNSLWIGAGCESLDRSILNAGAFDKTLFWETSAGRGGVTYVLYEHNDYCPERRVLAEIEGERYSECKCREVYKYMIPDMNGDYFYEVELIDDYGRIESSGLLSVGGAPEEWQKMISIEYEDCVSPVAVSAKPCRLEDKMGGVDVVIVARSNDMGEHVEDHMNVEGKAYHAIYGLDVTIEDVRVEYGNIVANNLSVNTSMGADLWPVDPGPLVIIAGAASNDATCSCIDCIPYCEFSDSHNRCRNNGVCYSDYIITDHDYDDIPNGPVTRIPAIDPVQVAEYTNLAIDYSSGNGLVPYYPIAIICDDEVLIGDERYRNDDYRELMEDVSDNLRDIGYAPRGIISTYDIDGSDSMRFDEASSCVNKGIVELWGFGLGFSYNNWGNIIRPNPPDGWSNWDMFTSDNIFIAWMPVCKTALAGIYCEDSSAYIEKSIANAFALPNYFHEPTGCRSRLAGMVGHIDAGWDMQHMKFQEYLLEERGSAVSGIDDIAIITYRAVRAFIEDEPLYIDYAKSVGVIGSYLRLPVMGTVGVDGNLADDGFEVTVVAGSSGRRKIQYCVPCFGHVTINIYDLRGRKVRGLFSGVLDGGVYATVWDGKDNDNRYLASSMYLCLVKHQNDSETLQRVVKMTIVR